MSERGTELNIGIVGLGGMGQTHAANVEALGHSLVSGADVIPEVRTAFEQQFGVDTYDTHSEMYQSEDLDVVIVTTPNKFHEPSAVEALEQDISVFVEKPLAHTLESAKRIEAAATESDGEVMVGFHNRFSTGTQIFKGYQEHDEFGDLTHVQANYIRRRGMPGRGSWFTNKDLSGGGALIDIGVHALDFALYLIGFPEITEVKGITRDNFGSKESYHDPDDWFSNWNSDSDRFDVDDSVTALLSTAEGQTVSLEVSWAASQESSNEFTVRGTEGGARLELGGDTLTMYETCDYGVDHYVTSKLEGTAVEDLRKEELQHFLTALEHGDAPTMNTLEEALTVQRVIEGIYRSSETGRAQELPE